MASMKTLQMSLAVAVVLIVAACGLETPTHISDTPDTPVFEGGWIGPGGLVGGTTMAGAETAGDSVGGVDFGGSYGSGH